MTTPLMLDRKRWYEMPLQDKTRKCKSKSAAFWLNVRKTKKCWIWTGMIHPDGYGMFRYGQMIHAHRFSWFLHNGIIFNRLCVLHRCDNRRCVNPAHLFLGTQADNNKDRDSKGRQSHGANHPKSKLSWKQVCELRRLYRRGVSGLGTPALGKKFGIVRRSVYMIVNGLHRRYE